MSLEDFRLSHQNEPVHLILHILSYIECESEPNDPGQDLGKLCRPKLMRFFALMWEIYAFKVLTEVLPPPL